MRHNWPATCRNTIFSVPLVSPSFLQHILPRAVTSRRTARCRFVLCSWLILSSYGPKSSSSYGHIISILKWLTPALATVALSVRHWPGRRAGRSPGHVGGVREAGHDQPVADRRRVGGGRQGVRPRARGNYCPDARQRRRDGYPQEMSGARIRARTFRLSPLMRDAIVETWFL